jgi:pimeloyl-ACP methyl ester carboxylesterase
MKKIMKFLGFLILAIFIAFVFMLKKDIPIADLEKKYTNQNSKTIDIQGIKIYYKIEGVGQPILLIHGTGSCLQTWDDWTKELVKDSFQVIRLDLPGFGLTGPNPNNDYSITFYNNILNDFAEKLKLDSFDVAGNSLGGQIAWRFAIDFPKRVKKLVLLDPGGAPNAGAKNEVFIFKFAKLPIISSLGTMIDPKIMVNNTLEGVYFDKSKITADKRALYYDIALREGNRKAFVQRIKQISTDSNVSINMVSKPTLIQWGKEDKVLVVEESKAFEVIPNHTLHIFEKVGHSPQEEIPLESVQNAIQFLKTTI